MTSAKSRLKKRKHSDMRAESGNIIHYNPINGITQQTLPKAPNRGDNDNSQVNISLKSPKIQQKVSKDSK